MGRVPAEGREVRGESSSLSKSNDTDRELRLPFGAFGARWNRAVLLPRVRSGSKTSASRRRKRVEVRTASRKRARLLLDRIKRDKGVWWMPWQQEAMKDVALCDKPGGGESTL